MTILVALAGVVGIACYVLACWIKPFGPCRWCAGSGLAKTWVLKRERPCRWCGGARRRLRLGRRVFNRISRLRREATPKGHRP